MKKPLMGMKTFCSEGDFLVFFSLILPIFSVLSLLGAVYCRNSCCHLQISTPPFYILYGGHIRFALDVHTSSYSS